jgi:hypothetical protein
VSEFNLAAAICSRSYKDSAGSVLRGLKEKDEVVDEKKASLLESVGSEVADRITKARHRLRAVLEQSSYRSIGPNTRKELMSVIELLNI